MTSDKPSAKIPELGSTGILEPPTQDKGLLKIVSPKIKVASGMHRESRISLWALYYTKVPATGVFVYPGNYQLTDKKIKSFGEYSGDIRMVEFREFKDVSFEELDAHFLKAVAPLQSFMDNKYRDMKTTILNHLYSDEAEDWIRDIILNLKG